MGDMGKWEHYVQSKGQFTIRLYNKQHVFNHNYAYTNYFMLTNAPISLE